MKRFLLSFALGMSYLSSAVTPFELQWMNAPEEGVVYSSHVHPNSIFVVEAYFLNCPYCNDNAPKINALQDYYSGKTNVQILDVGIDKLDSQYERWIERHEPNHPVLKDAKRTLIRQLGTSGYPTTYVLDANLNVIFKNSGVLEADAEKRLKNAVDRALAAIEEK